MIPRFVIRPDPRGFCVYDIEADAPATIAGDPDREQPYRAMTCGSRRNRGVSWIGRSLTSA